MHSTITDHWSIVKIIPWYLKQTTNHGLVLTCGNILIFKPFQMLIGQVQLIIDALTMVIAFFLIILLFLRASVSNPQSLDVVLKLNIKLYPILLLKLIEVRVNWPNIHVKLKKKLCGFNLSYMKLFSPLLFTSYLVWQHHHYYLSHY
jgi:hypothetical protein